MNKPLFLTDPKPFYSHLVRSEHEPSPGELVMSECGKGIRYAPRMGYVICGRCVAILIRENTRMVDEIEKANRRAARR